MDSAIDFAYKYPFSKEAREVISAAGALDRRMLTAGKVRLEEDLNSESPGYGKVNMAEAKKAYVLSYVYSRMLISAVNNRTHIEKYVSAESTRVRKALEDETLPNIMKLASQLGLDLSYSNERFVVRFTAFLHVAGRMELVRQELDKGLVYLPKEEALDALENAAAAEIRKKLPIPAGDLPTEVIAEAKTLKLPKIDTGVEIREGSYRWIERLLANPIADVRHRTVNLVLAPYLTNVKGLSEEDAAKVILDYIERCKLINPDTKVNSSYVKYQCKYAKAKGMKPLSRERAKELYRGVLDLE